MSEISDGKQPDGRGERKDLQVGNRKTMETSLIPFLPISTEEETSFATLTLHREEREAVRESNCIFLSLLLHAFLIKRGETMCRSRQAQGIG